MSRFENIHILKAKTFLSNVKKTDLIGREFTRKEFEAIFKGTSDNNGIVTLDWLKKYGELNGEFVFVPSADKISNRFVTTRKVGRRNFYTLNIKALERV